MWLITVLLYIIRRIIMKGADNVNNKYLTVKEASEILNMHVRKVTSFLASGKLKGAKMGRQWRLDEKDVRDFFEEMKKETAEALKKGV